MFDHSLFLYSYDVQMILLFSMRCKCAFLQETISPYRAQPDVLSRGRHTENVLFLVFSFGGSLAWVKKKVLNYRGGSESTRL